jgi:seryl-tRNA synthetase
LTLIRSQPGVVREALRLRRERAQDEVLAVDVRRRAIVDERDNLRAEQNQASKGIGRSGKPSEEQLQALREMRERIRLTRSDGRRGGSDRLVLALPNLWTRQSQTERTSPTTSSCERSAARAARVRGVAALGPRREACIIDFERGVARGARLISPGALPPDSSAH